MCTQWCSCRHMDFPCVQEWLGHGGVSHCCTQRTQLQQAERAWPGSGLQVTWTDLKKLLYLGTHSLTSTFFIPSPEIFSSQNKDCSLVKIQTGVLLALSPIGNLMCVRCGHLPSVPDDGKKCVFPWGLYGELLAMRGGLYVAQLANEKDSFNSSVYEEFKCSASSSGRLERRESLRLRYTHDGNEPCCGAGSKPHALIKMCRCPARDTGAGMSRKWQQLWGQRKRRIWATNWEAHSSRATRR